MEERVERGMIWSLEGRTAFKRRKLVDLIYLDLEKDIRRINSGVNSYVKTAVNLAVTRFDPVKDKDFGMEAVWKKWLAEEDFERRNGYYLALHTPDSEYLSPEVKETVHDTLLAVSPSIRTAFDHADGYRLDEMGDVNLDVRRNYLRDIVSTTTFKEIIHLNERLNPNGTRTVDVQSL